MDDWRKRFLELYMSKETADLSAALELKREHIPRLLYRYRGVKNLPRLLDEICGGEIYLTHPKDVNDPYEKSEPLPLFYQPPAFLGRCNEPL